MSQQISAQHNAIQYKMNAKPVKNNILFYTDFTQECIHFSFHVMCICKCMCEYMITLTLII